jgi:copper chaperone CopZ
MSTTTFAVDGMTCGNCVRHVTEELTALPGVTDVHVDLVAGGSSPVTVTSDAPLSPEAIAGAVDEAGYAVTPRGSLL